VQVEILQLVTLYLEAAAEVLVLELMLLAFLQVLVLIHIVIQEQQLLQDGGNGGNGGSGTNDGVNGVVPGGGGGGSGSAGAKKRGGNGARGRVTITYPTPPGCGSGGGEDAAITANSYNSICPGVRETVTWNILENANGTIPQNQSGDIVFTFVNKLNYIFTGNDLSVSITSSPNIDLNDGEPAPTISLTDDYTIVVSGLVTGDGGGATNSQDRLIITAEVEGVGIGNDVIERCGGSFTTNFIDDGTDVAFFYANTMSYVTTTVAQASTDDVPPNSINNEILVFNVSTTNGACNPIDVTEIVWTTTGTTDLNDVSEATIFYTGNSNLFVGINPFDNTVSPSGTITMNGTQSLELGNNYFWVAYNLPITAVSGNFIDASAVSVTVGGTSYDVTSDPAGNREIGAFFTTGVDGNWNAGGTTWNLTACGNAATAGTPGLGTNAIVCDGRTVTLTANASVKNLVVDGTINLGNNNLTVYGNLSFVSGTINAANGNVTMVGANKVISGTGSINFSGTGILSIEEDIFIDASGNITVTTNDIVINSSAKKLTNNGFLVCTGIDGTGSAPMSDPEIFVNSPNSYVKFTGAGWTSRIAPDFDNGVNTVDFAGTITPNITHNTPDNNTFWHVLISAGTTTIPATTFYIKGNFTNNATLNATANANTIEFNGTSMQTIGGSSASTFNNLTLKNSTGYTLGNNISTTGVLNLDRGVVTTGVNTLIQTNVTPANFVRNTGYIYGNFRRHINSAGSTGNFIFPIAKGTALSDYHQIDITTSALAGTNYLTASVGSIVEAGDNIDANIVATEDGTLYDNVVETSIWTVNPDGQPSGGSYTVTLYTTNLGGLVDNKFSVLKRPSGSTTYADWSSFDATTTIPAVDLPGRTVADGYAIKSGFTAFSEFGVGTAPNVLPIELLYFNAHAKDDKVELVWATATEINNDYFTIERSSNGTDFEEILKVYGVGNSSETIEYFDVDYEPLDGKSYYRLKQTDFDGMFTYSKLVSVVFKGVEGVGELAEMKVFPNPSTGEQFNLSFTGFDADKEILVVVRDITGKEHYSKVFVSNFNGELATVIDPNETLAPGTYLVIGSADDRLYSKKLVVR
jgi:hypothetical protein